MFAASYPDVGGGIGGGVEAGVETKAVGPEALVAHPELEAKRTTSSNV